jgi:hypothetical protein
MSNDPEGHHPSTDAVGGPISTLIFACPATGRTINTGIDTDERTLWQVRAVSFRLPAPIAGTITIFT